MAAAHPIVIVENGKADIPSDLRDDPQFSDGAPLQLVPVRLPDAARSPDEVLALWENLRGILADSDYDPNAELEFEKQKELAEESGWLLH